MPLEATDLGHLIGHRETVRAEDTLEAVHRRFAQHVYEYMAVLDGGRILGLCARRQIGMILGARFGFAINSSRPVREAMLPSATQIKIGDSLHEILRTVFTRPDDIFFDDVLLLDENGAFLGVIFARTLVRLQQTLLQQNIRQLESKTAELNRRHEELENDLRMASEVQLALLPQQYPEILSHGKRCLSFYHRYEPSSVVSGDIFYVFSLNQHKVGVFICDVMGHGVRSALITAMLRTLVQELGHLGENPGELLVRVNSELKAILKQTGELIYATGFFLTLDVQTGSIRYAKAGHPEPLCLRSETLSVTPLACPAHERGPALGLFEGSRYGTVEGRVASGDIIFFLTDGLFEIFNALGVPFGETNVAESIKKYHGKPLKMTVDGILDDARNFSVNRSFEDDVCLVGMEIDGLRNSSPDPNSPDL